MNYRDMTYGRELRAYESELAKAAALHQRAVSTRRGRVVFIAGQPKSGRTDLLFSLGRHLAQLKPAAQIIGGRFHSHQYFPAMREYVMTELGAAVGETLAFVAKLIPEAPAAAADFIGQLLQAGSAAQTARADAAGPHNWREELKRQARQATKQQPVIYLVDNLDHAGDLWLPWLLQDLATEIDRDLPLLVFVTLEAPAKLGEARDDEPALWKAARGLLERGVAEWWPLTPLTRAEVAAYISNARPGIAEHLHQVTGGFPRRVVELWHDWQTREVVWWSDADNCWCFDQAKHPSLNLVKDVIDDRLRNIFGADDQESLKQAREVLAYGALASENFAVVAVAQALDWDSDDLIDFIDDELLLSEENPNGLLLEAEALSFMTELDSPRTVWRYCFANDLFWLANFQYGLTEGELPKASAVLFNVLQEVHGAEVRLIAGDLARLCRNSGATDTAQHFQKIWDHSLTRERMRSKGLFMAQADKCGWSFWQKWVALDLLLEAGELMVQNAPVIETSYVLTEGLRLAAELKQQPQQALAGYCLGFTKAQSGDYEQAATLYDEALNNARESGYRVGEANCLQGLAHVSQKHGNFERAVELYDEALKINRVIGRQHGESNCLRGLAEVMVHQSYFERAANLYDEALKIDRKIRSRSGEAACLQGLAAMALPGDLEQAATFYREALNLERENGRLAGEAACLVGLAEVSAMLGDIKQAETLYRQSLALLLELGMVHEQAQVKEGLAALAILFGSEE